MAYLSGLPPVSDSPRGDVPSAVELLDDGLRAWREGDRLGAASAWHQALHAAADQRDNRSLGAAHFNLAVWVAERGDDDAARAGFASAYAAWAQGVDRRWVAQALAAGGQRLHTAGELGPARRHLEAALALRRDVGDHAEMAGLLDRLGEVARGQSAPAEARVRWVEAIAMHRRLRDGPGVVAAMGRLALLEIELGRVEEARDWALAAIDVTATEADLRPAVDLLTELAGILMGRGEWRVARECASAALKPSLSDGVARADLAALLATIAWVDHDAPLALQWGREALEGLRARGDASLATLLHDLGVLALGAGDGAAAGVYFDEALGLERDRDDPEGVAAALLGLAEVAHAAVEREARSLGQ